MEIKKTLANISRMHKDVSEIFKKKRKIYEYLDDFTGAISQLIETFDVFSHHIIWECVYNRLPEGLPVADDYILRDTAKKGSKIAPAQKTENFNYPQDEYFPVSLPRKDFIEKFANYFTQEELTTVFEISLKPGYSYFNLPVFSEDKDRPQWILTLVYREENSEVVNSEDFFDLMTHVSSQTSLAWQKFRENTANTLLRHIDDALDEKDITRSDSTIDQLYKISRVLSGELSVDWCAFFRVDEEKDTLKLEISNIDPLSSLEYPLHDSSDIRVKCVNEKMPIRLFGRESLENIVHADKMKPLEKEIRNYRKQGKLKAGKKHFTPYVLFEHAFFSPIMVGDKIIGLFTLYRAKKTGQPEPPPRDRFTYVTRPFSDFDIFLLKKVRRYVANIFIFHQALQKRMKDIRNVIDQVVSPISEAITATGRFIPRSTEIVNMNKQEIFEKMRYINALSRITTQYARNFETLLDFDTRVIKLKKEEIADLRGYLIEFARLYTPLIRQKCISINVTRQTPSSISIVVDRYLFDMVISNIIDNAIKYSFDPEDRMKVALQPKPRLTEDKENVLITAEEKNNSVTIRVSSYGIELSGQEKNKIFDREYRGSRADDRSKGTGIGLYLTREIIEMHDGDIELEAGTPPFNTVFKITLPKRIGQH